MKIQHDPHLSRARVQEHSSWFHHSQHWTATRHRSQHKPSLGFASQNETVHGSHVDEIDRIQGQLIRGNSVCTHRIPSGELTFCHGKSPFLMGKSTISTGPFSIAMLVHQRVRAHDIRCWWSAERLQLTIARTATSIRTSKNLTRTRCTRPCIQFFHAVQFCKTPLGILSWASSSLETEALFFRLIRAAGTFATIITKDFLAGEASLLAGCLLIPPYPQDREYATIKLRSTEIRKFPLECWKFWRDLNFCAWFFGVLGCMFLRMFLDDHGHSLSSEHGARASIGQLSHLERAMRFKGPTRFCPNMPKQWQTAIRSGFKVPKELGTCGYIWDMRTE